MAVPGRTALLGILSLGWSTQASARALGEITLEVDGVNGIVYQVDADGGLEDVSGGTLFGGEDVDGVAVSIDFWSFQWEVTVEPEGGTPTPHRTQQGFTSFILDEAELNTLSFVLVQGQGQEPRAIEIEFKYRTPTGTPIP